MASLNPFDLLGDDDSEDTSQLIAKVAAQAQPPKEATVAVKLPSKPLPPSQAVREAKSDAPRSGRGGFRGGSRGRGYNRDSNVNEIPISNGNGNSGGYRGPQEIEAGKTVERNGFAGPRGGFRGGRRGGFNNGDAAEGERPRRNFERRSGTGRGNEFKREGAGRGNWGTPTDEITPEVEEPIAEGDKVIDSEKVKGQEETGDVDKDVNAKESEEKEPEAKEMTLEEYEKVNEEKRKALLALKPEERKVNLDKEFESMQLLSNKKNDEDVFAKLGSEKDKRKDAMEKAKKVFPASVYLRSTL
ncbi:hypothetical protein Leryth_000760 [Lithospermum erythrorhizon]|nr:hypothetical protein Leryth_000760 [Lithospermum erythrorhizon]